MNKYLRLIPALLGLLLLAACTSSAPEQQETGQPQVTPIVKVFRPPT